MPYSSPPRLIVVLGHTAAGKTSFAAALAKKLNGEIISADSRQVYKYMDIGTGKDYEDYLINGEKIKAYLIDLVNPGYEYNVYEYQNDFIRAWNEIQSKGKQAILCGGSGLYLDAVIKRYKLISVPVNEELRKDLSGKSIPELTNILSSLKSLHNVTDTGNKKRLLRAIEIEKYIKENPDTNTYFPDLRPIVLGIKYSREKRRERITIRLKDRLQKGMIEEARKLINSGISPDTLVSYGLEYKYLTWYITGKISYEEMFEGLNTAIHQFAKRQMTWFRKMEREGIIIHWIDGEMDLEEKIEFSMNILKE